MVGLFFWSALASASSLQILPHDPLSRPAPVDACDIPICQVLVERIDAAERSIDVALYGLRNQTALMDALTRAQARGVRLRVVVDMDVEGENYYTSTDRLLGLVAGKYATDLETDKRTQAVKEALKFGDACERPAGFLGPLQCLTYDLGDRCLYATHASREPLTFQGDIMHNKFVVVDRTWVWTGSANASDSGTGGYNANLVVTVDSPVVAGWYVREFEQMFGGRFHGEKAPSGELRTQLADGTDLQVLFSPQDKPITTAVRPLLQSAKKRIDVGVFFLTHKEITRDLIEAHKRGVKVRVLMDATGAKNEYTKHEILREAGIPVKVEDFGGKMHAKSAVVDGEVVVAGSMNWTNAGEGGNDENTLIIRSARAASVYQRWFDRLWAAVDDRWLQGRPDPESWHSGTACSDGVDNDFDNLADAEDPGCSAQPPPLPLLPPHTIEPKPEEGCRPPMDIGSRRRRAR